MMRSFLIRAKRKIGHLVHHRRTSLVLAENPVRAAELFVARLRECGEQLFDLYVAEVDNSQTEGFKMSCQPFGELRYLVCKDGGVVLHEMSFADWEDSIPS